MTVAIRENDLIESIADALQYISVYHPPDFVAGLAAAFDREESPVARQAMAQILVNSRMSAIGKRPLCQDTGAVNVFMKIGAEARIATVRALGDVVDDAVRKAYLDPENPLRASMVRDPLFDRVNTRDNTPAILHVEMVAGSSAKVIVAAKGGGSENKAKFANLRPSESVADWVVNTVETLGAGWCPPGILGIGVGGSAEKAMLMAKESLLEPINMSELLRRGPASKTDELRIEIFERVNALGIGAQGLGGLTTVIDVKLRSFAAHAASKPVGLIPQCAADRHVSFVLDGSGPARFTPPDLSLWPEIDIEGVTAGARRVNLDALTGDEIATWKAGETLLLSGHLLTGRDAAHKWMDDLLNQGQALPVSLKGRALYYVGPVAAVRDEAVGPAGPTTATRMDTFTPRLMAEAGLRVTIGKAERGPKVIDAIAKYGGAYLIAVGGAAYLVSKAIKEARVVALEDLGMEAIHEFRVKDMPVIVAVDSRKNSIHLSGPTQWRRVAMAG